MREGNDPGKRSEKRYQAVRNELVGLVERIHMNNQRIEELVEQFKELNKLLLGLEGKLMRLALDCGVDRKEYLAHYRGAELDPGWMDQMAQRNTPGWQELNDKHRLEIEDLRAGVARFRAPPNCRSSSFAASPRPSSRASAKPARPRRKWSRPTCASSSPSPRNTPTAAAIPRPDTGRQYRPDEGGR